VSRRTLLLLGALAVQFVLIAVVSAPRLSPRLTGDEYRIAVAPIDPIDPFRGAYVELDYGILSGFSPERGREVWVPIRDGRLGGPTRPRPEGPALRCRYGDRGTECGIESFFASQDEAKRLERVLGGGAIARIKVDGAGRAAIIGIEEQ